MDNLNIYLTPSDRLILDSYKDFAEGLSNYLGDGYEIVLHSLENVDRSAIKVINGFLSGRKDGAPITDLALSMLSKINNSNCCKYISYQTKNKKDEPIKATTIAIKGENNRIIGLMCINFYLNTPFSNVLMNYFSDNVLFNAFPLKSDIDRKYVTENFAESPDEIITKAFEQAKTEVFGDETISASNKNKEIIAKLYHNNLFVFKDSVVKVADLLGISKNTVYLHLRNINNAYKSR